MSVRQLVVLDDGTPLLIREALPSDAEPLLGLVLSIFGSSDYLITRPEEFLATNTVESERQLLQHYYETVGHLWLLAELDGQLVGTLNFHNGAKQRVAHVGEFSMGLAAAHRGRGIGRHLLQALLDWARAHPLIEKIQLGVLSSNTRAWALYQRLGFEEEGREPRAIKLADEHYDDVIKMYQLV